MYTASPTANQYICFVALCSASLLACKDDASRSTTGSSRSDAVKASGSTPAPTSTPAPHATTPSQPRVLCDKAPAGAGRKLPEVKLDTLVADGELAPADRIETGGGSWTWINFWAGWCEPCKEEIPRLRAFAAKDKRVRVVFVSLDDDERQSKQFLNAQPAGGFRSSLWLKDDPAREALLSPLRIDSLPTLPFHLLFDPSGKFSCQINGAIDDADTENLHKIFASK